MALAHAIVAYDEIQRRASPACATGDYFFPRVTFSGSIHEWRIHLHPYVERIELEVIDGL
jgi:hypothetical protein